MYCFERWQIADDIEEKMRTYINHGVPLGGFLRAVFENNLVEASSRADDKNQANLPAFAAYIYNHAPFECWGSKEKVDAWIERRGLETNTRR